MADQKITGAPGRRRLKHEKTEVVKHCDQLSKCIYSKRLPCVFTEHEAILVTTALTFE
jgi:hypothetical protein